jgi:hypothetical protein
MIHQISRASARSDFTVEIEWECGTTALVDLSDFVMTAEVALPLRDPAYFVNNMSIGGSGDWIGWPGDIDIDADSLWYQAHPEDWRRDYGSSAAE